MKMYPFSRKANIVVQEIDGEVLIYDLAENKAFCLNETSAVIWQLCDGNRNISEIAGELSKKLGSPANEDLVWLAIDQLSKERLIENGKDLTNSFPGMSRREVVKKVGLGSMIALPIIASLAAPSAVFAQSCTGTTGNGGSCSVDTTCMSCCCDTTAVMACVAGGTVANGMNANVVCQCQGFPSATLNGGMCVS